MSDHSGLLPKWFTHGGVTLAKGQNGHSYTFWSISIYLFKHFCPVTNFGYQTLEGKNRTLEGMGSKIVKNRQKSSKIVKNRRTSFMDVSYVFPICIFSYVWRMLCIDLPKKFTDVKCRWKALKMIWNALHFHVEIETWDRNRKGCSFWLFFFTCSFRKPTWYEVGFPRDGTSRCPFVPG